MRHNVREQAAPANPPAVVRAASGTFTATNSDCAKRCIQNGSAPAFISEQAQAVFTVKDYPAVADDLGFRVEELAEVDEAAERSPSRT